MKKISVLAASALLACQSVYAQISATPEPHKLVASHGNAPFGAIAGQLSAIYRNELSNADNSGVAYDMDIAYGDHELQKLDVYTSTEGDENRPVLVYARGGGFSGGDKGDEILYGNVMSYFVKRGMVGVNINYRLSPEAQFPDAAEDVLSSIEWTQENIADYGGDPSRIFVMGHSAGAAHIANYLFNFSDHADQSVLGAILISGPYVPGGPISGPYYGEDTSQYDSMNPILLAKDNGSVPVMLSFAELDNRGFQNGALQLAQSLCERDGTCPALFTIPGHNHLSEVYHINTADDSAGFAFYNFMQSILD